MNRRPLILGCTVLAALTAALGDEPRSPVKLDVAGLHNVFRITPNLYSGSGPEGDEAFAALQKLGIKTVLSVDGIRIGVSP
jgi:hypothetical protein